MLRGASTTSPKMLLSDEQRAPPEWAVYPASLQSNLRLVALIALAISVASISLSGPASQRNEQAASVWGVGRLSEHDHGLRHTCVCRERLIVLSGCGDGQYRYITVAAALSAWRTFCQLIPCKCGHRAAPARLCRLSSPCGRRQPRTPTRYLRTRGSRFLWCTLFRQVSAILVLRLPSLFLSPWNCFLIVVRCPADLPSV